MEKVSIDLNLANILVLRVGHVIKVQLFCCLADKRMKVEFEKGQLLLKYRKCNRYQPQFVQFSL